MEERQFLHKLCINALQVDDSIEFAGVVDSHGKLLVGKSRDIFRYNDYYKKRKNNSCSRYSNSYGKAVFKDKTVSVNNIKRRLPEWAAFFVFYFSIPIEAIAE